MEQHQATGKLNELAMGKVFLYCDESGAKGYADKDDAKPGEVGGHPLAANLDAFINWGDDPIGDGMYAHPLRHPRA